MAVGRGNVRVRRHTHLAMLLTGDWVVPVSGPPIADGAVLVEAGKIVEVGPFAGLRARHTREEVRELPGCAILPGFVNAHTHLDYSAFRGFPRSRSFMGWIIRLTRARTRLDSDDLAVSAVWGAYECLRRGVTSIADTSYGGITVARAALAAGLRARVYLEVFGLDDDRMSATLERLSSTLKAAQTESGTDGPESEAGRADGGATVERAGTDAGQRGRVEWGVSPHAPYTVSQRLYEEVAHLARTSGLRMATHLAESKTEVRLLGRGAAPAALLYRVVSKVAGGHWRLPKKRPLQYLAESGALGPDVLAVHAVQVDGEDIQALAASGTRVAHCPRSNLELRCGAAPVAEMRAAGVTVGLGTDSLASTDSLDMLTEMKVALAVSDRRARETGGLALRPAEVLRMATLDGAVALGWEDLVGSLEPGKIADMAVVQLADEVPENVSSDELAMAITSGEVKLTMVAGEVVCEDGEMPQAASAGLAAVRAKLGLRD